MILDRILCYFVRIGVVGALGLGICLIFMMTLGYDEAWLISMFMEAWEQTIFEWKMAPWSLTNGGPFFFLGTLFYGIFGTQIWIFRLFVFCFMITSVFLCARWSLDRYGENTYAYLVLAIFLGSTGTIELGALVYGCVPAFCFLLLGLNEMEKKKRSVLTLILLVGIFFGIAASIRLNCLIIFPALLVVSFLRREKILQSAAICGVGLLIFCVNIFLLATLSPTPMEEIFGNTSSMTGLMSSFANYPALFNRWVIGTGNLPIALMVVATAFAFFNKGKYSSSLQVLTVFGWIHGLAWLLRSPIPHLRYLWPSIAAFAIVLGFGVASVYKWQSTREMPGLRRSCLIVALAVIITGCFGGFRSLIHGDVDVLSWEWSGESRLSLFRAFDHVQDQKSMATYLQNNIDENEVIGVIGINQALEILSKRKLVPLQYYKRGDRWKPREMPQYLIASGELGHYVHLSPEYQIWMKQNLKLEKRFGVYALYKLVGNYPDQYDDLWFRHFPHSKFLGDKRFIDK